VRNLYFIHFELSWYGATPGKRIVGIRVIDRRGGPLLPSAVIARNLTREVEIFIPLGVLISASAAAKSGAWEYLVLGAWLACFAGLIFFNRDRMRAGDLIAGTVPLGFQWLPNVSGPLQSGDAKALAVTVNKRMQALPNVPTVAEAGIKNYETSGWLALLAPRATPKSILAKLQQELAAAAADPRCGSNVKVSSRVSTL
jgi:uncharacterized RDD family membrane protein YckC